MSTLKILSLITYSSPSTKTLMFPSMDLGLLISSVYSFPQPENRRRSLKLSHNLDSGSSSLSWFRNLVHCIDFSCFHLKPKNLSIMVSNKQMLFNFVFNIGILFKTYVQSAFQLLVFQFKDWPCYCLSSPKGATK